MSISPIITVIVAVYNGENTLQRCIDSFLEQDCDNKELIIIDGASTDRTLQIIERNKEKIKYYSSEPDKGIYDAWNKGLKQANGEWICFLGADDYFWENSTLKIVSNELALIPKNFLVAYGKVMLINFRGEKLFAVGEPWIEAKKKLFSYMSIPHQGVMHRRDLFVKHGDFDPEFRIAGDYDLLLRELKLGDAFFVDRIFSNMEVGGISSDPKNHFLGLREFKKARVKNNLPAHTISSVAGDFRVLIRVIAFKLINEKLARVILDLFRQIQGKKPYWTKAN